MTILNRDILTDEHGPYLDWACRQSPLASKDSWPSRSEYKGDVFFEMADDLLQCLCRLTRQYAPFDIYEVVNLSDSASIGAVLDVFQNWAGIIEGLGDDVVAKQCGWLYAADEASWPLGDAIKRDLLETMAFLIERMNSARSLGQTIAIVGI